MRAARLASFGVEKIRIEESATRVRGRGRSRSVRRPPRSTRRIRCLPLSDTAPYTQEWDLACHLLAVVDGVNTSLVGSRVVGSRNELPGGQRL